MYIDKLLLVVSSSKSKDNIVKKTVILLLLLTMIYKPYESQVNLATLIEFHICYCGSLKKQCLRLTNLEYL